MEKEPPSSGRRVFLFFETGREKKKRLVGRTSVTRNRNVSLKRARDLFQHVYKRVSERAPFGETKRKKKRGSL